MVVADPFEEPDGVEDGVEGDEAPLPAVPPVVAPELELELGLVEDAPPLDWSFFSSIELDEEELDGAVLDGLDGVVVEPADDELEGEDGAVDDGLELVEDPVPLGPPPPPRLQAVSMVAASAMDTAIARVDLMWPPWLG